MRRTNLKREDGVAMTEFALIVPVFLVITVGLLSFGRILFYWIQTNHVATETARWAVVDRNPYRPGCPTGTPTGAAGCKTLQQEARDSTTAEFASSGIAICIDYPDPTVPNAYQTETDVDPGEPVRVRVQRPFTVLPLLNVGTVMIRGSSTMRVERFGGTGTDPTMYTSGQNIGTCT